MASKSKFKKSDSDQNQEAQSPNKILSASKKTKASSKTGKVKKGMSDYNELRIKKSSFMGCVFKYWTSRIK